MIAQIKRPEECPSSRAKLLVSFSHLPRISDDILPILDASGDSFKVICPSCGRLRAPIYRVVQTDGVYDGHELVHSPVFRINMPLHLFHQVIRKHNGSKEVVRLTDQELQDLYVVARHTLDHQRKPRMWMPSADMCSVVKELQEWRAWYAAQQVAK